jgi:hypothetical protein
MCSFTQRGSEPADPLFRLGNIRSINVPGPIVCDSESTHVRPIVDRPAIRTAGFQLRDHRIHDWPVDQLRWRGGQSTILHAALFEQRPARFAVRGSSVIRCVFQRHGDSVTFRWSRSRPRLSNSNFSRHRRIRQRRSGTLLLSVLTAGSPGPGRQRLTSRRPQVEHQCGKEMRS